MKRTTALRILGAAGLAATILGGVPVGGTTETRGKDSSVGHGTGGSGMQQDAEFLLYYRQVQKRIKDAWSFAGTNPERTATVTFGINPDGSLNSLTVNDSSHDPAFDDSVVQAIRRAAPFAPPPEQYRMQFRQGVKAVFELSELASSSHSSAMVQSAAWPKSCKLLSNPPSWIIIGEKTDGYPSECLLADIEWTNCLRVTKPFADNPKMLAEAEEQRKRECHEALLAKYPEANETFEEMQAKAKVGETHDMIVGGVLIIVAGILIVGGIIATIWFALAFAEIIIPLALLVIALHFLGCF